MRRTLQTADECNVPFLASALTFDALLAAVPFVLLLLIGLTQFVEPHATAAESDLNRVFERFLPPHSRAIGTDPFVLVEELLTGITQNRGRLSLYAMPLFVWFSTRLFAGVRTSLNAIFDVPVSHARRHGLVGSFLVAKLRDVAMVGATLLLFVANASLSASLGVLEVRGASALPHFAFFVTSLGRFLGEFLAFGFALSLFFLTYKHASFRRLPWRTAMVGATFSAVMFEVAKRLFGLYLLHMASFESAPAGANVGAAALFVLWSYYTAVVFLLGAAVAHTFELRRLHGQQRAVLTVE